VNESFASSDIYCLEFVTMVNRKIRSNTAARLVPRCGVARKIIAEIALIIFLYSGSI